MKSKITQAKNYSDFIKVCCFFKCKELYPNWDGYEKYIISSSLSHEELSKDYPECIKELSPFLLVSSEIGDIYRESINNDAKYNYKNKKTVDFEMLKNNLGYYDSSTIESTDPTNKKIELALNALTPRQKERLIMYYFQNKTLSEIANKTVSIQAVNQSIKTALKKIKKYLEKG